MCEKAGGVSQAHAATDAISKSMWKRALRALNVGVEAAVSPQCRVPLQVRNPVSGLLVMQGLRRQSSRSMTSVAFACPIVSTVIDAS